MPRAVCHFSLYFSLQEQLRYRRPQLADLMEQHLAATLAGLVAPDALRMFGKQGKLATHFYVDHEPATWGRSVESMCRRWPNISDPEQLRPAEQAFILGYISHLTVDEAFRETITTHLTGHSEWRKIVAGLWSLADDLPVRRPHLAEVLRRIGRPDIPEWVDSEPVCRLLSLSARMVKGGSWWEREQIQQTYFSNRFDLENGQLDWAGRREMAADFFVAPRRRAFIDRAITFGLQEIGRYWDGCYRFPGDIGASA